MTVPGNIDALLLGGQRGYQIERSLRFNSADSAYLNRTFAAAGNRQTWTWSGWIKRSKLGTTQNIFGQIYYSPPTNRQGYIGFTSSDTINYVDYTDSGYNVQLITSQVFRDVSAWYHIVCTFDTTNATSGDRVRLYVNGTRITTFGTATYPSQNYQGWVNADAGSGVQCGIGRVVPFNTAEYLDGYLTEVHFIDGQALIPSSFGETDTITGVWKPKRYSGSGYGTNGFYLNFKDNSSVAASTLGKDYSGNGNNWTPTATFSVTAGAGNDSLIDTPTPYADGGNGRGNYCTFNPLLASAFFGGATLKNGNLQVQGIGGVANTYARGTMAILGKAYAEFYFDVVSSYASVGVVPINDTAANGSLYTQSTNVSYRSGGNKRVLGTESAYGASWVASDIIGVAVDPTANTIEFFKNGTSQGVITSSSFFAQGNCTFAVATDDVGSPQGYANFGQRSFSYTPPAGFLALNTQNLPEPSIKKPSSYFDTLIYTGDGSTTRSITGLSFSPDLLWHKSRSAADDHRLMDSVRAGGTDLSSKTLFSNLTSAEDTSGSGYVTQTSSGFNLGVGASPYNVNTRTYVAWCWDEGATPGFDIVTFTGTGAVQNISHSLGVAPSMMIGKSRNIAGSWAVYHASIGANNILSLNSTNASTAASTVWNNTAPTSSQFTVGSFFGAGETDVAYLFSEVAGFSKFGSYTGNGSTDGVFIYCGFRPAFFMIKRTDSTGSWIIFDNDRIGYNQDNNHLLANASDAEYTDLNTDIVSNGFKFRSGGGDHNGSGATYVFAAWAESPFKYSLAR